jgi:hypothetical protein
VFLGNRARLDAWSLLMGRDFESRNGKILEECYAITPSGEALAALNSVDHFRDVKSTTALMAGFLNGVGRRREALKLTSRWEAYVREKAILLEPNPFAIRRLIADNSFTVENISVHHGFDILSDDVIMLHPNNGTEPDATCTFYLYLLGHSRLVGVVELRNPRSLPVEFQASLSSKGEYVASWRHTVEADAPVELEFVFEPVFGPVELRLSTRMFSTSAINYFAWATWQGLKFLRHDRK